MAHKQENGTTVPFCIDCSAKITNILAQLHRQRAETLNYLSDEMAFVAGVRPMGPRFPTPPAPIVHTGGVILNSINVSNSNIGVINTGRIESIDSAVGYLSNTGGKSIADALKALTEAVANTNELAKGQQAEAFELLSLVATEAAYPAEQRRSRAILPTIAQLGSILSATNALSQLWTQYGPAITSFFSSM